MSLSLNLFDRFHFAFVYFLRLSPGVATAACLIALTVGYGFVILHECAHWLTARAFGVTGAIGFFTRRAESKVWFLSVMGVKFDDGEFARLTCSQIRLVAVSGPLSDVLAGLLCLIFGLAMPGPAWLSAGVALAGLIYLPASALNIVPLPLRNDGWLVLWPKAAFTPRKG
ncbi:RIP metalloprotease [Paraburkholderia sp. UYCP14C]|uniref:site-2 protease family protein n=1 Tax=Paraburkholderia sp. UYCP14C TaxID=2511130 RepID=UPI00101ECEFF|nr:site-2 protease family protein [Paraburkholderia sp. UYCP14C]RZF26079.1 RIP metalloprotease [Paraburkholderia sp. UYCP14C]